MERDSFFTIESAVKNEIKVQRSKFIAYAFPVGNQLHFQENLDNIRKEYYDASHFPFAYRIGLSGNELRYSDDGEPAGSGGKPVMDVIDKFGVTDTGIIVVRYFGGVKLGVGGLRRAFFEAAEECMKIAVIKEVLIEDEFSVESDYKQMSVIMNMVERYGANILSNDSDEKVKLKLSIRRTLIESILKELTNLTSGNIIIKR